MANKLNNMKNVVNVLFFSFVLLSITSCGMLNPGKATKELVYFRDADSIKSELLAGKYEPIIRKKDVLYIGVHSVKNDSAARVYNLPNYYAGSSSINANTTSALGFMVDADGYLEYPRLGKIKVEGMTKNDLIAVLQDKLKGELLDAVVTVRFTNYRITVLGEVEHPSAFDVPDEQISVLEAIGLAGDLTPYGRRDNVLVIRDRNGKKEMGRIDLNTANSLSSPYYYLSQDDIVYIEPNKRKLPNSDQTVIRNLSIVTSIVSTLALVITLFKK